MTEEELIQEIDKPVVSFVAIDNMADGTIMHCYFEVTVSFKLVEGVKPYPDLSYNSTKYKVTEAEAKGEELLSTLADRVEKHKLKHATITEKQGLISSFLAAKWGV